MNLKIDNSREYISCLTATAHDKKARPNRLDLDKKLLARAQQESTKQGKSNQVSTNKAKKINHGCTYYTGTNPICPK